MSWAFYAVLSAFFASLVAIFGKIGVQGVDSNLAVAIRTVVIVIMAWAIVLVQGNAKEMFEISRYTMTFLVLSALATGASWLFYYKALQLGEVSRVAPIDKLSIALTIVLAFIFLGGEADGRECARRCIGGCWSIVYDLSRSVFSSVALLLRGGLCYSSGRAAKLREL